MRVKGYLTCYSCGYISAEVEGEHRAPLARAMITWRPPGGAPARPAGRRLRCLRCGGTLYLALDAGRVAPASSRAAPTLAGADRALTPAG